MADDGGIDGPPVVVGHSMGGFVTIATAARHRDQLAGVDRVRLAGHRARPRDRSRTACKEAFGRPRTYATVEEALARFRTVPPQEHYLDYVWTTSAAGR